MFNVYDSVCSIFTGATGEVVAAAKDSGVFAGQLKVRYNNGRAYHVRPEHLIDAKFSSEIIKANKQKRSACLEGRVPLDPIQGFHNPVFATAGGDDIEDNNV